MKPLRLAALVLPLFVAACSGRTQQSPEIAAAMEAGKQAASAPPSVPQSLELIIDGQPLRMEVDSPRDGHVSVNNFVRNTLTITAMDRTRNIFLTVSATPVDDSEMGPGTYQSYKCAASEDCTDAERAYDEKHIEATLMPFPGNEKAPNEISHAFKSPTLKLDPTTLVITSMENAYWHGVGPTKRVKGTFSGTLASIERGKDGGRVVAGPLRKVEGKFDVYTGRLL